MTAATVVTSLRIALAPVFIVFYFLPIRTGFSDVVAVIVLWVLLAIIETSDVVDGRLARHSRQVTDLGKLFDPFADVIARMTYFTCFILSGVMPVWVFVVVLYREFGVLFLRMQLTQQGVALGAKTLGKLKSVFYFLATVVALAFVSFSRVVESVGSGSGARAWEAWYSGLQSGARVVFVLAAVLSLLSFVDYIRAAARIMRKANKTP
jgi:CDP-diacylglycerol---glycerol-3-phosphate 3-phosphatidyltransferase